ncbi:MAG: hypothetical protein O3A78_02570 [Nitrospinae bacterium]|nr:hypothetical protein [Nitrospinota bacterium]MDA1108690.1 hypothetical protein [Nitrospinota bacterium]
MLKYPLTILILGLLFISSPMSGAYAHGGHKKEAVEMEAPAAESSIYSMEEDTGASSGEAGLFPLSNTDSLSAEMPTMESMDHDAMGAMDHKMPTVEIAKREWVSPKQKGYGVAVGITLFAGLIFGVLQFKRPNE